MVYDSQPHEPPGTGQAVCGFLIDHWGPGFGWLLDRDLPRAVFACVAALSLLTILTLVQVRRGAVPATARA